MNEKKLQLVTYEQAVKLKKLGFDWNVNAHYDENYNLIENSYYEDYNTERYYDGHTYCIDLISAPTVALALKWMWKEKYLLGNVNYNFETDSFNVEVIIPFEEAYLLFDKEFDPSEYETAESALLDELLIVLKEKLERGEVYENN